MFNIACFLGNDFLPRSDGNGEKRATEFINQISNENGDVVKSGEDSDQIVLSYTKEESKDGSVKGKRQTPKLLQFHIVCCYVLVDRWSSKYVTSEIVHCLKAFLQSKVCITFVDAGTVLESRSLIL